MVRAQAPQLLELPGCGVLGAAKLLGEIAGASLSSDAQAARLAGVAPIRPPLATAPACALIAAATASSTAPCTASR